MFEVAERERLRAELLAAARADVRLSGGAITGSAARGAEDRWSDVDLAFGVRDGAVVDEVLADWTAWMYARGALHHLDVRSGAWIYRVFLLPGTLQVDLAFAPAAEFGARASSFALVFGEAVDLPAPAGADAAELIGLAWLDALHARTSIARGRPWQAEYMIARLRENTLALACLRHQLPAAYARGFDRLPPGVVTPEALVRDLSHAELRRAFGAALDAFLRELEHADPALAVRLRTTLDALRTDDGPPA